MRTQNPSLSLSDSAGHLLFYTDTKTIWNKDHEPMAGGDSLGLHPLARDQELQQMAAIPAQNKPGFYFLFMIHEVREGLSGLIRYPRLTYTLIDMNQEDGRGKVVERLVPVMDSVGGASVIKDGIGNGFWLITHEILTSKFYSIHIDSDGNFSPPVVSVTGNRVGAESGNNFFMPSLDGNLLFSWYLMSEIDRPLPALFKFDKSSGRIEHWFSFPKYIDKGYYGSACFSSSGRFLYLDEFDLSLPDPEALFQYDLHSGDSNSIIKSKIQVFEKPDGTSPEGLMPRLAPDGSIIFFVDFTALGQILYPDKKGSACNAVYPIAQITASQNSSYSPKWYDFPNLLPWTLEPGARINYRLSCFGDSAYFKGWCGREGATFHWNFGDSLSGSQNYSDLQNPVHWYGQPGQYIVKLVTDYRGLRDSTIDTITITAPQANPLGQDTSLCEGDSLMLSAFTADATKYIWSTGVTEPSITVKETGTYWIGIERNGCMRYDTVQVDFVKPYIDLGADTIICPGTTIQLDAAIPQAAYTWSNRESSRTIEVTQPGTYSVVVKKGSCTIRDTILISPAYVPQRKLPKQTSICLETGETYVADAGEAYSYQWQPGGQRGRYLSISDTGTYTVTVSSRESCARTDTIKVERQCPPALVVPTAFSPNKDTLNDIFLPVMADVEKFEMVIYNRWGEEVFRSDRSDLGWDGNFKGMEAPEGIYLYRITYEGWKLDSTIQRQFLTGKVYLLR